MTDPSSKTPITFIWQIASGNWLTLERVRAHSLILLGIGVIAIERMGGAALLPFLGLQLGGDRQRVLD